MSLTILIIVIVVAVLVIGLTYYYNTVSYTHLTLPTN